MENIIVGFIILSIVTLSIYKIVSEKRKGVKCVGCALSTGCSSNKKTNSKVMAEKITIKEL
jgi:hypothetical protein